MWTVEQELAAHTGCFGLVNAQADARGLQRLTGNHDVLLVRGESGESTPDPMPEISTGHQHQSIRQDIDRGN